MRAVRLATRVEADEAVESTRGWDIFFSEETLVLLPQHICPVVLGLQELWQHGKVCVDAWGRDNFHSGNLVPEAKIRGSQKGCQWVILDLA